MPPQVQAVAHAELVEEHVDLHAGPGEQQAGLALQQVEGAVAGVAGLLEDPGQRRPVARPAEEVEVPRRPQARRGHVAEAQQAHRPATEQAEHGPSLRRGMQEGRLLPAGRVRRRRRTAEPAGRMEPPPMHCRFTASLGMIGLRDAPGAAPHASAPLSELAALAPQKPPQPW